MRAKILVVDDEKFIVEAITQHLTHIGHDVHAFMDPHKAMSAIEENDYDLVLTDLRMPEISGMDITRAVQAKSSETLIIILTGYATLDSAIESVRLHVYSYLNKPFDLRQLGHVVDRALTEQRLKRENEELHGQITTMVEDLTTIHEVGRLLNDNENWPMIMEFVLDTINIGFGISYSGLIVKETGGIFKLGMCNVPSGSQIEPLMRKFEWDPVVDKMDTDKTSALQLGDKDGEMFASLSTDSEVIKSIILVPIRYRTHRIGYLVVLLHEGAPESAKDLKMLLRVLATQIAPLVYHSGITTNRVGSEEMDYRDLAKKYLSEAMERDENDSIALSVNLLRFITPRDLSEHEDLVEFHEFCASILARHENAAEIHWLTPDTALVIIAGVNQVQAGLTFTALAEEFQHRELEYLKVDGIAMVDYATTLWPHNSSDMGEIVQLVWSRLMHQIHETAHQRAQPKPVDD